MLGPISTSWESNLGPLACPKWAPGGYILEVSGHFPLVGKSLFLQTPVGAPSVRPRGPGRRNAQAPGRDPGRGQRDYVNDFVLKKCIADWMWDRR